MARSIKVGSLIIEDEVKKGRTWLQSISEIYKSLTTKKDYP